MRVHAAGDLPVHVLKREHRYTPTRRCTHASAHLQACNKHAEREQNRREKGDGGGVTFSRVAPQSEKAVLVSILLSRLGSAAEPISGTCKCFCSGLQEATAASNELNDVSLLATSCNGAGSAELLTSPVLVLQVLEARHHPKHEPGLAQS